MSGVVVRGLTFSYSGGSTPVLRDVSFELPFGSRCLLVGRNGAGKSTLLQIVGGVLPHSEAATVSVLSKHAFRDTSLNEERLLLDPNWGLRTVAFSGCGVAYTTDLQVGQMMASLQKRFPERRERLLRMLGVSPEWHWNRLSDGQRRRVQLFLGFLYPFKVLLMDEVTALLDVVCRFDIYTYLRQECAERGCVIISASHVFDGLECQGQEPWPTHVLYLTSCPHTSSVGLFGHLASVRQPNEMIVDSVLRLLRAEETTPQDTTLTQNTTSTESEQGELAIKLRDPLAAPQYSAGGYAPVVFSKICARKSCAVRWKRQTLHRGRHNLLDFILCRVSLLQVTSRIQLLTCAYLFLLFKYPNGDKPPYIRRSTKVCKLGGSPTPPDFSQSSTGTAPTTPTPTTAATSTTTPTTSRPPTSRGEPRPDDDEGDGALVPPRRPTSATTTSRRPPGASSPQHRQIPGVPTPCTVYNMQKPVFVIDAKFCGRCPSDAFTPPAQTPIIQVPQAPTPTPEQPTPSAQSPKPPVPTPPTPGLSAPQARPSTPTSPPTIPTPVAANGRPQQGPVTTSALPWNQRVTPKHVVAILVCLIALVLRVWLVTRHVTTEDTPFSEDDSAYHSTAYSSMNPAFYIEDNSGL
ncbi:abc transporter family protein [Pelomyxa schiedti]|nr:abc transporter family protein [Pelomyxa schiedti]